MHVPDHLINDPTETVAAVSAVAVLAAVAIRAPRAVRSEERTTLLAEPERTGPQLATAALVFALQMVNVPVLPGTSGHLLGGALATALIGPRRALLATSAVVVSQAVFFADGGAGAIGVNLWLIAILPVAVAALAQRLATSTARGGLTRTIATAGSSALLAAPLAALAFVALHLAGGVGAADPLPLARSMVGVHLAIGVGEALVTVAVLGALAVVTARTNLGEHAPVWAAAALGAGGLSLLASPSPDGLERVVGDLGIAVAGPSSVLADGPLAGYEVTALDGWLASSTAGLIGLLLTSVVAATIVATQRAARPSGRSGTEGGAGAAVPS